MNKFVFVILVLCCLALVKAVDFQNQQSTPMDYITAPKGSHIVLRFRVITSDEPAVLLWKGEGVKIEFHDITEIWSKSFLLTQTLKFTLTSRCWVMDRLRFTRITVFCSRKIPNYYIGLQQVKNQGWSVGALQPLIKSPKRGGYLDRWYSS